MNTATLSSAIAPVAFGVLALFSREHNRPLVAFLVLWFIFSAIQILWAFIIQRRNPHLGRACVAICLTQLAVFFLLFFRYLPLPS
jgi:predicted membrane-bound mannosyltransferase